MPTTLVVAAVVLPLGTFWLLLLPGTIVYLFWDQHWVAAAVLSGSYLVGSGGQIIGAKNARQEILNGHPALSPFEGTRDLAWMTWIGAWAIVAVILTDGPWRTVSIFVLAIAQLWAIRRQAFRILPRWHRYYYPIMLRYMKHAARESVMSKQEDREFQVLRALAGLIRELFPIYTEAEVDDRLAKVEQECSDYSAPFEAETLEDADFEEAVNLFNSNVRENKVFWWPRMFIGQLVDDRFGPLEKSKLILALAQGKAT